MDTRLRVGGHLIQPMLVTYPLGLFVCATVFDLTRVLGAPVLLGEVGYYTAVAGLVAGAMTAMAGVVDLWDAPPDGIRRAALTVIAVNLATTAMFLLGCVARSASPGHAPSAGLLVLEAGALTVGAAGVRLGVRLGRRYEQVREAAADPPPDGGLVFWADDPLR